MTVVFLKRKGVLFLDPCLMCPKLYLQSFGRILEQKIFYDLTSCGISTAKVIGLRWWTGGMYIKFRR